MGTINKAIFKSENRRGVSSILSTVNNKRLSVKGNDRRIQTAYRVFRTMPEYRTLEACSKFCVKRLNQRKANLISRISF